MTLCFRSVVLCVVVLGLSLAGCQFSREAELSASVSPPATQPIAATAPITTRPVTRPMPPETSADFPRWVREMREAVRDDFPLRVGMTLQQVQELIPKDQRFSRDGYRLLYPGVEVSDGHGVMTMMAESDERGTYFWCDLTIDQSSVTGIWLTYGNLEFRYGPSLRLAGEGEHRTPTGVVHYAPEGSDPDR